MKTKSKKQTKQGISLIVLVITIIVMIILAAAVILSLSSNGIIDRANEAVDKTDLKQMQTLASTLWAEAYLDYKSGDISETDIIDRVKEGLAKVDEEYTDKYNVMFSANGVELSEPTWEIIYDKGEQTQEGMLYLGEENLFNTTDEYRITIERNGITTQIETKLLYTNIPETGEEMYIFAIIKDNTVIYPETIEELDEILENTSNEVGVFGACGYMEGQCMCVLFIEDYSDNPIESKIVEVAVKSKYIDEGWDVAYTCTNGVWSNYPIPRGKEAKGDIVAKFYKIGSKVDINEELFGIPLQVDEYRLVIIGEGVCGVLLDENDGTFKAWLIDVAAYNPEDENSSAPVLFGVTEVMVSGKIENAENLLLNTAVYCSIEDLTIENANINITQPKVGENNVSGNNSIKRVSLLGEGIQIGDRAFTLCNSLESVVVSDGVRGISNAAFAGCTSLTNIILPNSITSMGEMSFLGCTSLTNITLPSSITSIGRNAFYNCSSLASIIIPNSITSIEEYAFYDCDSLITVNYTGTEEQWKQITIGTGNEELLNAKINYNYVID